MNVEKNWEVHSIECSIDKININTGEKDIIEEDFIAKIDFIFPGIQKGHEGPLDFEVTNYQLFRIKK